MIIGCLQSTTEEIVAITKKHFYFYWNDRKDYDCRCRGILLVGCYYQYFHITRITHKIFLIWRDRQHRNYVGCSVHNLKITAQQLCHFTVENVWFVENTLHKGLSENSAPQVTHDLDFLVLISIRYRTLYCSVINSTVISGISPETTIT